jgi:hypothetical protein
MKVKYIRNYGLFISKLENRPMGVTLPLIDYATGDTLPEAEQLLEVTEKEGLTLINCGNFIEYVEPIVKSKKIIIDEPIIEEQKEVIDNG